MRELYQRLKIALSGCSGVLVPTSSKGGGDVFASQKILIWEGKRALSPRLNEGVPSRDSVRTCGNFFSTYVETYTVSEGEVRKNGMA